MCCFSGPVRDVHGTHIFARSGHSGGQQFIVYSMTLEAESDLAMILPIPAAAGRPVRFINLKEYPGFFDDLNKGCPLPPTRSLEMMQSKLEVKEVGAYEASFVPSMHDFDRLDPRFSIPTSVWQTNPVYEKYGFVVFKLKHVEGAAHHHPMAFSFYRPDAHHLFFPTVHVHDGAMHKIADFDHSLYAQPGDSGRLPELRLGHEHFRWWIESPGVASSFANLKMAQGILDPHAHCYRIELQGPMANVDAVA
ncbi:MAG: hypothetical protein ACYCW6_05935 [Candidatus Xenobia bacterium]